MVNPVIYLLVFSPRSGAKRIPATMPASAIVMIPDKVLMIKNFKGEIINNVKASV